jgi:beta-glucosidase-like glycosyl hydrolase/CubicO group peptidase (beta-lactamase class C family)
MRYIFFLLIAPFFLCFALSAAEINPGKNSGLANLSTKQAQGWVDSVMNSLTLRQQIAQLFMVAAYSNKDQTHIDEITKLVKEERIGGLCFFQGGPVRQANLTNYYQKLSNVPMLISMDAEWGLGMRLDSTFSFPRQMMLGAMNENQLIYQMGADIAQQLKRLGVHINFAPVVDVNNNPANPVINTRAFGEDMEDVSQKGLAYMLGLQDNGIIACAKHFPGHGDTGTDSHYALPLLNHSSSRIDSLELYPFRRLIQNGIASIMVGHMEIPALEPKRKTASSISKSIVTSLLQEQMDYKGLIFTDAMNMKGVSELHKAVSLNYMALKAGNDIILFPLEVKESISRIEREVKHGRFPAEEIERRCRKVIEAKYMVGLNKRKPIVTNNLVKDLNKPSTELQIRQIAEQAITVANNNNNLMPLTRLDTLNIAYIEVGKGFGTAFKEQLEMYASTKTISINPAISEAELRDVYFTLLPNNLIIIGYHAINSSPSRNFGITPQMANFINEISRKRKTIVGIFGSPYALTKIPNPKGIDGLILSYDNGPVIQKVTAQLIFGGATAVGRLPVTATTDYPRGSGISLSEKIRLKYSIPEELHLKSSYFQKIDSIALNAIEKEAAPGMQILVAHKGVVVYNENFGSLLYNDNELKVNNESIYDVASVTKISATLPIIMDLYSKGKLSLTDSLKMYLAIPKKSEYNRLVVRDVLLHQAGLPAWIHFYPRTLSSLLPKMPVINGKLSENYPYKINDNRYMSRYSYPSRDFYRNYFSFDFPHEVARGIFAIEGIKDSIFSWIFKTPLEKSGVYKYSDLGFIMLHRVVENIINMPQEEYLEKNFYSSLGMNNTLFNPLNKITPNRIAPTENDLLFRKQLIWGYVHDPGAAMMGGVAGHAGLFSNANDLAKLMQMYLNKGEYGGIRYFPASTIDLFTSCANCMSGVRRGLGFDKPEPSPKKSTHVSAKASSLSFGHTGFTGIMTWVDPAYDLVYIFVSNRVFPNAENTTLTKLDVRTKIQDVIYAAIIDVDN